jgi:neutral trehalase
VVGEIYRKYGEKWLPELLFDDLLTWNRWWPTHRSRNNLLHWGSDSLPPPYNDDASNAWQGAAYESGLDNSPMFDGVPFNKKTHLMEQADVGLTSLYIADCNALAELALVIGRKKEATELKKRSARYAAALRGLWDEEKGIFLNRRTDTGKPNPRISPTNFYPMLAGVVTPAQAARMMKEHYFNPQEFYGDWVMPSVPRNDPAYAEQNYWRGRIWGPLNFLVYLGMRKYDLPEARKDLARRSDELLLNTFRRTGMVHENYNAVTGNGLDAADPPNRSDSFYHWGGLLGLPALFEGGFLGQPTDTGKHRK